MANQPLIMSIDQGTTSSRAILFDRHGASLFTAQREFRQIFPASGWVEHDPEEIWETVLTVCREALQYAQQLQRPVVAIGITNQRETTLVWDRATGRPVYNAIVWQDRRTAESCAGLREAGHEPRVTATTGLLLDPYFSATKVAWILQHVAGARDQADRGELLFGTIDSFLLWRLTEGARHVTDVTNASRTLLYDIHRGCWDEELLQLFGIPASMLPEVLPCAADFGSSSKQLLGEQIPICGIAGDQQAAAFGQACFEPGMIKSTYGTGCFVLMNTGDKAAVSNNRLLTTIAYRLDGATQYAIEGSIFVAGAAVQWLRDGIGLIESAADTEALAASLEDNRGVYLVPAFTGLGAPYWDADARGGLFGLTRATGVAEIVRATLESVCYQSLDLFRAMAEDGQHPTRVRVDGGMIANNWLAQFLADILDITVQRPQQTETTALGAAYLAGLQCGLFNSLDQLTQNWQQQAEFIPAMEASERQRLVSGWRDAVQRVRS